MVYCRKCRFVAGTPQKFELFNFVMLAARFLFEPMGCILAGLIALFVAPAGNEASRGPFSHPGVSQSRSQGTFGRTLLFLNSGAGHLCGSDQSHFHHRWHPANPAQLHRGDDPLAQRDVRDTALRHHLRWLGIPDAPLAPKLTAQSDASSCIPLSKL